MKIKTIQVQAGRTLNLPSGKQGTMRPFVTLTADLDKGDDAAEQVKELQILAENLIEDHVDELSAWLVARQQEKKRQRQAAELKTAG